MYNRKKKKKKEKKYFPLQNSGHIVLSRDMS
jgi:hypothetical protein